ncbi:putative uncharacterized protein FAM120A2P isoform X2 [Macaca nemestrina]|uniref:putative uncharacterized protein FAM120A2P isoform X2 n=1 Tax=Macaca nemestrina TaxID=9545 RepID=UPI0039B93188
MPGMVPPHVPPQMLNIPQTSLQAKPVAPQVPSPGGAPGQGPYPYSLSEPAPLTLDTSGKNLTEQNSYSNIPHEGKHTPLYERSSPINPAQSGSPNHVDSAYFPGSSTSSSSDNDEGSGGATNPHLGNERTRMSLSPRLRMNRVTGHASLGNWDIWEDPTKLGSDIILQCGASSR